MAIFYSGSYYTDTSFCYNGAAFHLQSGKKNKKAFWLQHRYFHDYETKAAQVVPVLESDAQFPKAVF